MRRPCVICLPWMSEAALSDSTPPPLAGRRIVVTRARAQAAELCERLAALGAQPIVFPAIEIAPLDDHTALDDAIGRLHQYDWIVFTSVNGVQVFWARLALAGAKAATGARYAAIGPATAQARQERGIVASFMVGLSAGFGRQCPLSRRGRRRPSPSHIHGRARPGCPQRQVRRLRLSRRVRRPARTGLCPHRRLPGDGSSRCLCAE